MIRAKTQQHYVVVDLTGPDGNAHVLLAYAKQWARYLGLDGDAIRAEMTAGDYENLVQKFDDYFGEFVILER
jgi:hypothetical protein